MDAPVLITTKRLLFAARFRTAPESLFKNNYAISSLSNFFRVLCNLIFINGFPEAVYILDDVMPFRDQFATGKHARK